MSDTTHCRNLTKSDARELHAFAAIFSAYMKTEETGIPSPRIQALIAELKRELSLDQFRL